MKRIKVSAVAVCCAVMIATAISGCRKSDSGSHTPDSATVKSADTSQVSRADSAKGGSQPVEYTFRGKVVSFDSAAREITIDGEKIDGYMEAMTMPYKVASPELYGRVPKGKPGRFTIRVVNNDPVVTSIVPDTTSSSERGTKKP